MLHHLTYYSISTPQPRNDLHAFVGDSAMCSSHLQLLEWCLHTSTAVGSGQCRCTEANGIMPAMLLTPGRCSTVLQVQVVNRLGTCMIYLHAPQMHNYMLVQHDGRQAAHGGDATQALALSRWAHVATSHVRRRATVRRACMLPMT
jgi:hypothetical protein